ncbi:hypothetical protein BDA99DRAFT_532001 [Phascolomyces articulosus]|uniref:Uncharacterized protein n=1 Tax=Phascolomyces articulosus TaxID=60185 RepID=A0AAD5KAK8_9FUNG|nr:hypothetical protein BDA99DRAFT_532001 [Phascolomyces articulosus]
MGYKVNTVLIFLDSIVNIYVVGAIAPRDLVVQGTDSHTAAYNPENKKVYILDGGGRILLTDNVEGALTFSTTMSIYDVLLNGESQQPMIMSLIRPDVQQYEKDYSII